MFTRLLVPVDGSARAERALPVAATIARARGATVTLLRVVSDITDVGGYMIPAVATTTESVEREEFEARDYLSAIARRHTFEGVKVETLVDFGTPARTILDTIKSLEVDGVIICSHGRTGLARWALGSVAQAIVRGSQVPVLLLRQQGPALEPEDHASRALRILVPLDGSPLAEEALAPAQALGEVFAAGAGYELHLARVIPFIQSAVADPVRDAEQKTAQVYLESVKERLTPGSANRVSVTTSIIFDLDAADALARMTRAGELVTGATTSDGCDLIAMATHGRTGLARLAIGSITERTLSATITPALVVRPAMTETTSQPVVAAAQPSSTPESWPALF